MDAATMIREAFANERALEGAAIAAMPGPAVRVKPLEWEWVVGDVEVAGPYKLDRMRPWRSGKPKKYWVQVALGSGFRTIATLLPSLDAAKAAAQADYEARILSALTPTPDLASENERLRAALTPSGNTKAAYIGEFSFTIEDRDEDGEEWPREITVPWATVKVIMKAIREYAALERT